MKLHDANVITAVCFCSLWSKNVRIICAIDMNQDFWWDLRFSWQ